MKKLLGNVLITGFMIFASVKMIRDFFANDGIHYYWRQPQQLLFAMAIGIVSGLIAFGFSALPPRFRRGIKLVLLALGGSFFLAAGGYLSFQIAYLQTRVEPTITTPQIPWLLVLGALVIGGLLWLWFCQVLKNRGPAK